MNRCAVVRWESCGTTWFGCVKFEFKEWVFVRVIGCADPKAFVPKSESVCMRKDAVVFEYVEEVKA